ncbi:hypothetical protein D915_008679 [Fasciola hepatica]|uniref:Nucleoporin GLE1 n=1 Tax=Fasciola hepatica TaxID=6192 RepID=A0A4E0QYN9_FASHE|nr:hypothetical protein D915_008679 [Fasciola hepatica]
MKENYPMDMDIEVAYQESLLDFNDAVRGYQRRCAQAQQRIRALLDSNEPERHDIFLQLTPIDYPIGLENMSPPRLKELPPLYSVPSDRTNETDIYPEELNQSVERIVSIRLEIYQHSIGGQAKSNQWNQIIAEIEEIEARVLSVLVLPSNALLDSSSSNNTNDQVIFVVDRLEAQAKRCLDAAKQLLAAKVSGRVAHEVTVKQNEPNTESVQTDEQCIPTLQKAQSMADRSTQLLYPLLSDYSLRKQTLCVKRMVGCASSQIIRSDPAHCLDRMNYLITLLEGGSVKSAGSATDSSSSGTVSLAELLPDNLGPIYAWQCLFSSAISQAEHQFAYNVDSTVVFAALLSGILARHPKQVVLNGLLETGASTLFALYGCQTGRLLSTIASIIRSSTELTQLIPEISLLSTIESAQKSRYAGISAVRLDASFWSVG